MFQYVKYTRVQVGNLQTCESTILDLGIVYLILITMIKDKTKKRLVSIIEHKDLGAIAGLLSIPFGINLLFFQYGPLIYYPIIVVAIYCVIFMIIHSFESAEEIETKKNRAAYLIEEAKRKAETKTIRASLNNCCTNEFCRNEPKGYYKYCFSCYKSWRNSGRYGQYIAWKQQSDDDIDQFDDLQHNEDYIEVQKLMAEQAGKEV
jgi:hypothetical protein